MSADLTEPQRNAESAEDEVERTARATVMDRLDSMSPRWATRRSVAAGLGLIPVLVLVLAWAITGAGEVIRGSITVSGDTMPQKGAAAVGVCTTGLGYIDVRAGTAVTVRDASGDIVAIGQLAPATVGGYGSCTFPFAVDDVPDSQFYTVEVGRRGEISVTADDLTSGGIHLSLGR